MELGCSKGGLLKRGHRILLWDVGRGREEGWNRGDVTLLQLDGHGLLVQLKGRGILRRKDSRLTSIAVKLLLNIEAGLLDNHGILYFS